MPYGVGTGVQHSSRRPDPISVTEVGGQKSQKEGFKGRERERGKQRIKVSLIEEVVLCFLREGIRGGLLFHLIQRYRGNAYIA